MPKNSSGVLFVGWFEIIPVEEAGRRAFERSNAGSVRNERLERLLNAVEHQDESSPEATGSNLATLLAHAGIESKGTENFPMAPPLHTATTYTRPPDGIYKDTDSIYARMDNPTRLLLERTVFALECSGLSLPDNAESTSLAFSSGMQAVTSILLAHPTANGAETTVLIPTDVYHGVRSLLSGVFLRHGVEVRELDMIDNESTSGAEVVANAIREIVAASNESSIRSNVIVWMETPSNPKCQVADIQAICDACDREQDRFKEIVDVTTVVDGTMASPVLTRPLELGADMSFHSGTKYMGGHSDALIGTLTISPTTSRGQELLPLLKSVQIAGGGVASPWDCWLTLRGMRTLGVRIEKQCDNALALAEYLSEKMPSATKQTTDIDWMSKVEVKAVHYPGLSSHPQHDIAKRQMVLDGRRSGFGGVLSFELGDEVEATAFCAALKVAQRATSLGGTETLVEHRASIEPSDCVVSPPGLLRVSVGLEHPEDLIRDFEQAFGVVEEVLTESKR